MLNRLIKKLRTSTGGKSQALKDGKKLSKGNCKCEPTACKCGKRRRQQQLKLLVSQLRRRDNVSSVILF
ncbi:uncharacterized protein LOC128263555 isoform X2 [Drosophila gunungcola]|uniref:uncharacterized protein LOC128263555 isoform X2 n=1 Tax=Drosophila gunungcola TaxID=103775 RepID=UPI0022E3016C|nr:uncharacterized protein LOC128263555 isoform X2 [Drosophila gunungcola]